MGSRGCRYWIIGRGGLSSMKIRAKRSLIECTAAPRAGETKLILAILPWTVAIGTVETGSRQSEEAAFSNARLSVVLDSFFAERDAILQTITGMYKVYPTDFCDNVQNLIRLKENV